MPTAIVTGATGILGRKIVHQLSKDPHKWTKIYTLSRSKSESFNNPAVQHAHLDLLADANEMAAELAGIEADYLFFAAYLEKPTEEEATEINGRMLQSFLDALTATSAAKKLKRIVLVTGCKQYGVHLGPVKLPMRESDPWLRDGSRFPPNFYYRQQDILREFCEEGAHGGDVSWTVTYPNDVIGFAEGNFMNLTTSLGLYAAVCRELGEQALAFPGSEKFYFGFDCFTGSDIHARFCEWAALEPRAANEAFNIVNGEPESWQELWPRLAARFGMKVKRDQFASEPASVTELNDPPPTVEWEDVSGSEGRNPRGQLVLQVDLVKWSQRDDVKEAWNRLAEREGLRKEAFEKATWGFLAFVLSRAYDLVINMGKARSIGWTGYVDTWDDFTSVFDELEQAKILPKSKGQ